MTPSSPSPKPEAAAIAWQRSQIYQLLAAIFGREPSADLLAQLQQADAVKSLAACGVDYQDSLWSRAPEERVEELEVEYTRLFIGPGPHIALQESVQRGEGQLWGEHTCDVVRWYARGGHAVDPAWTDLPDHLAVELQFLGALAAREAACRRDGETEQAAELAQLQSAFLQAHPVQWVPEVTRQISERAAWAYYRAFASLLERVLTGDIAHLESELLKR